jgi:molecular chaperone GrpE
MADRPDRGKHKDRGEGAASQAGQPPETGPSFSVVDRRPRFDQDPDSPDRSDDPPRVPSVVEALQSRAEEAERRAREISQAYRRIEEERDAFRQRLSRDLERRVDIARADLMRSILPLLDDLDRALRAADSGAEPRLLRDGVGLIRERLMQALAAQGVEHFSTLDQPFDPAVAEAVASVATDDPALEGRVIDEVEPGYRLRGTLLRPARVKVARRRGSAADGD